MTTMTVKQARQKVRSSKSVTGKPARRAAPLLATPSVAKNVKAPKTAAALKRYGLSRADIADIGKQLDAIYTETRADLGQRDADHIRKMIRISRGSAIAGRSLLMFGFGPLSFVAGVAALGTAKILENMEIGHNVMHGQYDWTNDPTLAGNDYEWDTSCDGEDWRHSHNVMHHDFTNIEGVDKDLGYGILRMDDSVEWKPHHLLNPINNAVLAMFFQYGVGAHDSDLAHIWSATPAQRKEILKKAIPFAKKTGQQLFKDYVFFPALGFWNAPRILVGNATANLARNLWSYAIIFCGHFPGTHTFTAEETANETKGDWYLRQLLGSANIEGGRLMHIMSGHLSHQIEHHLFPDVPAHRNPEMAVKVRKVCEQYGLPYNTGSFAKQFGTTIGRVFKYALPTKPKTPEMAVA
jgi:linoleoyl-CoA desaturase